MRRSLSLLLLFCAAAAAQKPAPIPDSEVPQRKEIFRNQRVVVSLLQIAPRDATPMHQHARDMISVFVTGGKTSRTMYGAKPMTDRIAAGEVRFRNAGFAHDTRNDGTGPFRATIIEFIDPQGKREKPASKKSHYCNPGSATACVDEKSLFCTAKVCVEDVTIAPGAVTTRHSHSTDHMLVAVSDYEFTDQIEGKGKVVRTRKSGEVEYIPAGITHQLTNTGKAAARFIVVVWR